MLPWQVLCYSGESVSVTLVGVVLPWRVLCYSDECVSVVLQW